MSQSSRANNTKQRNRRERLKHRAAASVDGGGKSNESGYSDKVQSPSPKPNAETLSSAPDIFLRGETEAEVKDRGDGDAVHIQSSQKENLVFEAPSLNLADGPVSDSKHMHQDFGRSSEKWRRTR
ncbi:hypothetical protein L0F63_007284 [Massospora cicadina]|nr:hypothetical protein L0F63_007284 [Massospora cicadina]